MGGEFTKRTVWLACFLLALSTTFALGQGIVTGSIAGTVVDPQKAVVVGAKVAAKNIATNADYKSTTNDAGFFSIRSIPIGRYTLTVEAPNFRKLEVDGITVSTSITTEMGALVLALGSTAETVTVEGVAPMIDSTSIQGGARFDFQKVADIPIANAFDDLAFFVPGVSTVGSQGFSNTNGEAFAVNGQRGRNNNFQIDGQSNNDNSVAGPALFFGNQDVLSEVSVITNNADVSYGRNSGAVVNYVTKSGTNNYHGTAFEYYTGNFAQSLDNTEKNSALGFCLKGQDPTTTGCTAPTGPPRNVENRWGGTIGGPIKPNKIWFFGSYMEDHTRSSGGAQISTAATPTPDGIAILKGAFPGNAGVAAFNAIGPYAIKIGDPHPVGTVTNRTVSDGTTSVSVPFALVSRNVSGPVDDWETGGRADFQITPKDLFFARYYYQKTFNGGSAGAGLIPAGQWVDVFAGGQQIALDWTRTFTNHFVNQVRFSYERLGVQFDHGSNPNCTIGSIHICSTNIAFTTSPATLAFGLQTNLPQGRLINNSQWQDNASLVKGRHTFKFGGEYTRQRSPNVFLPVTNGSYSFPGFSAFLQNKPNALSLVDGPASKPFKEQDASLYFSDEWRLRENLILTLGVRYEYWQQAFNLLHDFTVATQTGPHPFWNTALPLSQTTFPALPNDTNNFGPSIGIAWTPHMFKGIFGENKTVIRAGYRVGYDPQYYNLFLNSSTNAPTVNSGVVGPLGTGPCTAPCLPTSGFTGTDVRSAHLGDIPTGGNPGFRTQVRVTPDFHNPYVQTWTFGLQREISSKVAVEAKYVGSHTVGEFQTLNGNPSLTGLQAFVAAAPTAPNPIPAGATACATAGAPGFAAKRLNCNFSAVTLRANSSWAMYHGLQTELRIRQWHGATAGATYTFSKTMDNASEAFSTTFGGQTIAEAQDPFNINVGERGLSGLDFPHVVSVYLLYELPWFKNQQGLMGHVLGGWQINTTYRFTSGELWTPRELRGESSFCDNAYAAGINSGIQRCRPFLGNPGAPVDMVGQCTDPTLPDCGLIDFNSAVGAPIALSAVHWILNDNNSAVFFGSPYGMRRNPGVRGDHVNTINFSLFKVAKLSERTNLRLEAQVSNLFNTSYLGVPGVTIETGNLAAGGPFGNTSSNSLGGQDFGSVTATGLGRRTVALGAKFTF